jgi:copper resistance protein B
MRVSPGSALAVMVVAVAATFAALLPAPAAAEPLVWGATAEKLEYRFGEGGADALAWDVEAEAGTDDARFVLRSTAEHRTRSDDFEALETQARLRVPVTTFFDGVVGVRASTPDGKPDRLHGVLGIEGLAPQWIEVDADLFLSDRPFARVELEYEGLITNRLILTPSIEVDLPLADDPPLDVAAWAPTVEVGARLGYDAVDRLLSPYVGMHWERSFGETARLHRADGEGAGAVFLVLGARLMF